MYYTNYEDYMRNVLGYNGNCYNNCNSFQEGELDNDDIMYQKDCKVLESMYPESYQIIYPMVCKHCMENIEEINENTITKMTNDICKEIEMSGKLTFKLENRGPSGNIFNDFIKILIIRELLRRRPHHQHRPPFRPGGGLMIPQRPPFPRSPEGGFAGGPGYILPYFKM